MEQEIMCRREEVEHIVEVSTKQVRDDIRDFKREHEGWQREVVAKIEKRMQEIAVSTIRSEKEGFVRYVGWGGVVGIVAAVYFFGGLTNQVENLQVSLDELKEDQAEVNKFMSSGDRFTATDGNTLKDYVDQQDSAMMLQMKEGFSDIKAEIRALR
jgi:hypothetical protein